MMQCLYNVKSEGGETDSWHYSLPPVQEEGRSGCNNINHHIRVYTRSICVTSRHVLRALTRTAGHTHSPNKVDAPSRKMKEGKPAVVMPWHCILFGAHRYPSKVPSKAPSKVSNYVEGTFGGYQFG